MEVPRWWPFQDGSLEASGKAGEWTYRYQNGQEKARTYVSGGAHDLSACRTVVSRSSSQLIAGSGSR